MKKFLSYLAVMVFICVLLPVSITACSGKDTSITILHTNDISSAMDNVPGLITAINSERDSAGKDNTILLDAGDVFIGTLYGTLFQGEVESWFLGYAGYDAMCPGNHEFDNGPEWLDDFIGGLEFPVVCANLEIEEDNPLKSSLAPYTIVKRNGSNYGIIGLITPTVIESSSPGDGIVATDTITSARSAVAALQEEEIDKIIVLSHRGWEEDLSLPIEVAGIDIIIGGHSHTVPDQYPEVLFHPDSPSAAPTLVVQAGLQGQYLGRLNVIFDEDGEIIEWTGSSLLAIDDAFSPDSAAVEHLAGYRESIENYKSNIIGSTSVDLVGELSIVRSGETNLGNAVADSMLQAASETGATIAFMNGGGIRASIPAGDISLGNVLEVLPFHNPLVVIDITGGQLVAALENGVSKVEELGGRFPQVAGCRFTWDPEADPGFRIVSSEIDTGNGYEPLMPEKIYRIVTSGFLAGGGDGYHVFTFPLKTIIIDNFDYLAFIDYLEQAGPLEAAEESRITRLDQ